MGSFRKKIYMAAGYNTIYFGPGRKEFDPKATMPTMEWYLQDAAKGVLSQLSNSDIDEGVIGSFMAAQFLKQGNLPAFLPYMIKGLQGKACVGIEGACGTGGKALAVGLRSILSGMADSVFVCGFEIQNNMKSVYGADLLAGAGYYGRDRKEGHAFFFPGIFSDRTGAYFEKYGREQTRQAMARWYEQAVLNARKNPKAQEYHNQTKDLFALAMTPPDGERFVPHLNLYNCSKISDGASAIMLFSEEGLARFGIDKDKAVEIIGIGEAEGDIAEQLDSPTELKITSIAVKKALASASTTIESIGKFEIHDCFAINALLALEAMGLATPGHAAGMILDGETSPQGRFPMNLSGGLLAFGHPTGASGVRQAVDLLLQLTGQADNQVNSSKPYAMMISMGGNDKTLTSLILKRAVE